MSTARVTLRIAVKFLCICEQGRFRLRSLRGILLPPFNCNAIPHTVLLLTDLTKLPLFTCCRI
jgi:hypothetical protein